VTSNLQKEFGRYKSNASTFHVTCLIYLIPFLFSLSLPLLPLTFPFFCVILISFIQVANIAAPPQVVVEFKVQVDLPNSLLQSIQTHGKGTELKMYASSQLVV
jgi:hypothetical protein